MELIDIIPEFNLYEEFWKIYTNSEICRHSIFRTVCDRKKHYL